MKQNVTENSDRDFF